MSKYIIEVCIDSLESAKRAIEGGANRLELCSALSEGGLTPSPGLLKFIKNYSNITVYAMIRMRHGNFVYTQEEIDAMLHDLMILRNIGVDGFVFGALKPDRTIDISACNQIVSAAKPLPVTFHRAFDETIDPFQALEQIINAGFVRILTSGQRSTAMEGLQIITELVVRANNRIIIVPGSGITPDNIDVIKTKSGAREFHASARIRVPDVETEISNTENTNKLELYSTKLMTVASEVLIRRMVEIVNK